MGTWQNRKDKTQLLGRNKKKGMSSKNKIKMTNCQCDIMVSKDVTKKRNKSEVVIIFSNVAFSIQLANTVYTQPHPSNHPSVQSLQPTRSLLLNSTHKLTAEPTAKLPGLPAVRVITGARAEMTGCRGRFSQIRG